MDLLSLNDIDNKGNVVGTRDSKIDGILDRANTLLKDLYLRSMMKTEINYDINFTKWIDEGKTIIIQIPEHTFTNKQIKDTLVTYFMGRIWLSALQRKNPSKVCHVITDEIHQVPVCTSLLTNIITEGRKFGICFYFTIHFLKQFKGLLDAVKSSGASYMLLTGTEKENFNMLQEELQPFIIDDLLGMKPYHSLNYVNYNNQYVKYISKLPEMVK